MIFMLLRFIKYHAQVTSNSFSINSCVFKFIDKVRTN